MNLFKHLSRDIPAGIVVFLVALPLCLGIALASGAPLFSGIIAGIVGGLIVGFISGSQTSVSGPAAGLAVIILNAIEQLNSFELFLTAVFIAGVFQILLGVFKAGLIGYFFPNSVIKGMLAGIGLILIIKQFPYALGFKDGDSFQEMTSLFSASPQFFSNILQYQNFSLGSFIIAMVSAIVLLIWETPKFSKGKIGKLLPGALVAVVLSVVLNLWFTQNYSSLKIIGEYTVSIPNINSISDLKSELYFLDFEGFRLNAVWIVALTLAVIASLETLLSVEAVDKIDPERRKTPLNRELIAQGTGNIINSFVGGLPITAVIVRSSANLAAGNKTKFSAIFHGFLLVICVFFIPEIINLIPLSCLAVILIFVGYKLAKISLFRYYLSLSPGQFLPFFITVISILVFDLLIGIGLGLAFSVLHILFRNFKNSHFLKVVEKDGTLTYYIRLSEEVSFLNKGSLLNTLNHVPAGAKVVIDGSKSTVIDFDVIEVIQSFNRNSSLKSITVELIAIPEG